MENKRCIRTDEFGRTQWLTYDEYSQKHTQRKEGLISLIMDKIKDLLKIN